MLLRRLTVAFAAVGLFGSPVSSLYCPSDDPAAMACCQRDANDCNQPGKSDDCCRTLPTDGQTVMVASKAGDLAKPHWIPASVGVLPMTALAAHAPSVRFSIRLEQVLQSLPPPTLSVLRI